jgi:hypothetical protein
LRLPPEQLGQEVQCPACNTRFLATPTSGPAAGEGGIQQGTPPPKAWTSSERAAPPWPEPGRAGEFQREAPFGGFPPEEEWGEVRRAPGERAAWAKVRTGITLVLIALCATIGVSLLAGCLGGMGAAAAQRGAPGVDALPSAILVLGIAVLALQGLTVVGYGLCAAAPPTYGAKGLGVASLAMGGTNLVLALLSLGLQLAEGGAPIGRRGLVDGGGVSNVLDLVSGVLGVALIFVFLFFLRAVALSWNDVGLARNVQGLMILIGVLIALFLALLMVMGAVLMGMLQGGGGFGGVGGAPQGAEAGALGLACFFGVGALAALIWYIVILVQARNTIRI